MITIQELDIKEVFQQALHNQKPIYQLKSKFINILKESSKYTTSLSRDEVNWMSDYLDTIENIINSKKAISVFWCLFKHKECYIAQIARSTGNYTSPVRHWINNFKKIRLVEGRTSQFSNKKIFYHLNKYGLPNIIASFIVAIKEEYGEKPLNELITPDRKNHQIIDKQYNLIKKNRARQNKFKNTSHIG